MKSTVVHEVLERSHRIIIHNQDGTCSAGTWAGLDEVAKHKKYFAVVGESPLPQGVFTTSVVRHQLV